MNSIPLLPQQIGLVEQVAPSPSQVIDSLLRQNTFLENRLAKAQQDTMVVFAQGSKSMEGRFKTLHTENDLLRLRLVASESLHSTLVCAQRTENAALRERTLVLEEEVKLLKEERKEERDLFCHQIEDLRGKLHQKEELLVSQEQELSKTISSLRQELQQARQETLQRMEALQTEKEAIVQEVRESVLQQVANGRIEERALANQDAERRISLLKMEHTQELQRVAEQTRQDVVRACWNQSLSILGPTHANRFKVHCLEHLAQMKDL